MLGLNQYDAVHSRGCVEVRVGKRREKTDGTEIRFAGGPGHKKAARGKNDSSGLRERPKPSTRLMKGDKHGFR